MSLYRSVSISFSEDEMSDIDSYTGPDIPTTQLHATNDMPIKKHSSQSAYADGWERIFGKRDEQQEP